MTKWQFCQKEQEQKLDLKSNLNKIASLESVDIDLPLHRKGGLGYIMKTPENRFITSLGGGYTTAGNNLNAVRQSKHVIINLCEIEILLKQKPDYIKLLLQLKNNSEWHNCNFKLTSCYPYMIVEEVNRRKVVYKRP